MAALTGGLVLVAAQVEGVARAVLVWTAVVPLLIAGGVRAGRQDGAPASVVVAEASRLIATLRTSTVVSWSRCGAVCRDTTGPVQEDRACTYVTVGETGREPVTSSVSGKRSLTTVQALHRHRERQSACRDVRGEHWAKLDLVFPTGQGTIMDHADLRRALRAVTEKAGLGRWHPHELRHSAASLLSAAGVPLEEVADVLGHASTRVTSAVYRHTTTPTVEAAAGPMDELLSGTRHPTRAEAP